MPVVAVYRPNARSAVVSYGKGPDAATARLSGLLEAIEHYHAENILLPLRLGSIADLSPRHDLVEVRSFIGSGSMFERNSRLLWIEGFDLLADTPRWLPLDLVHLDRTVPSPGSSGYFSQTSTGLAAGLSINEALSHSLCEVIERDAVARWLAAPREDRAKTRIDLGTIRDGGCRALLDLVRLAGLGVGLWNGTSDIGVPVSISSVVDDVHTAPCAASAWGLAAHPDRDVALRKSLAEALQARLAAICAASEDADPSELLPAHRAIAEQHIRTAVDSTGHCSHQDVPSYHSDDPADDVRLLLQRLKAAGFDQAIMVDLTRPEFRIPVIRVVVPGMGDITADRHRVRLRPSSLPQ
jgi:YcaO-like protein with predicted kinase domain